MRTHRRRVVFYLLITATIIASWRSEAAEEKTAPGDSTFDMREVSAFEPNEIQASAYRLVVGQFAETSTEPDKAVKAYPKLKSKRPLFGKVKFARDISTGSGVEYHFVLDESGEVQPAAEVAKPEQPQPEKSWLQSLFDGLFGGGQPSQTPATPPAKTTVQSRYDRLYFDINGDLDLTNDPVLKPMKAPPWKALPPWTPKERAAFDYLDLKFDYGPGLGPRPFRILPWLTIDEYEGHAYRTMHFVATVARQGRIRIGMHEYDALWAQPYGICGRFDFPSTSLLLKEVGAKSLLDTDGFAGERLSSAYRIDGELYTFSGTPLGDTLTVKPYRGDFGLFRVGPGRRDIKDISITGCSLDSKTMAIGFSPENASPGEKQAKLEECRAPTGDYVPSWLSVRYGALHIQLSDNYHADGQPRSTGHPRNYFIKIRKDEPFVLDFSNKPDVLFASPGKAQTFKPGDEISVKAVLIDPKCDFMIRHLNDTTQEKKETKLGDGQEAKSKRPLSLDPLVTITDSARKKVAEGTMPFG